jgi:hypothetical protein
MGGRLKSPVQNAYKWRHIFVCAPQIFIIYALASNSYLFTFARAASGGSQPLEVGPSREEAPYLANRFICHIDVCLQCNLVYRARAAYIFTWFYGNRAGAERERER